MKPNSAAEFSSKVKLPGLSPYSGLFLKYTKEKLRQTDQRRRKLIIVSKALYPKDDMERVHVSRKGGWGLASIEDWVNAIIEGLEYYIKQSKEILITAVSYGNGNIKKIRKTTKTRKQECKEGQLYEYFKWQTGKIG